VFYGTTSSQSADVIQAMAALTGMTAIKRVKPGSQARRDYEVVSLIPRPKRVIERGIETAGWYDGEVWCLETRSGAFLIRRNGHVVVTGNCTDQLKLRPLKAYVGQDHAIMYVALTAEEGHRRDRLVPWPNVEHRYPFIDAGITRQEVWAILKRHGLADHPLYRIKPRSGCFCCFFQSASTWRKLKERHPELFEKVKAWEAEHRTRNGHRYGYAVGAGRKTLVDLEAKWAAQPELPLEEDDGGGERACTICRL